MLLPLVLSRASETPTEDDGAPEQEALKMACAPFPPPPRFYEEFEPHSSKNFKSPAPPPPLEGPYEVFGVRYDTSFAPQDPAAAHRDCGLDIEGDQQSPVATLRLLNRVLPEEYLKLMQVRLRPHHNPPAPFSTCR